MLKNLGKNEIVLLSIIGIVGILFLYYSFIFKPTFNLITNKRANITAYNKDIDRIEATRKANIKLTTDLKALQTKSDEDLKQLPFSARIPEVARTIKPLVESAGMSFGTVSFGKSADYAFETGKSSANASAGTLKLMSFPVSFSTNGDYPSIMKLINTIEGSDRIIEVDNVTFTPTKSNIDVTFSIHYYFVTNSKDTELKYDFNNGTYGKENLFK